jgi:hypothetical protein
MTGPTARTIVAIYPATSTTEKVRFNTLNRETGNRLKRQMVDAVSGEVVESEEQVKGYAVEASQEAVNAVAYATSLHSEWFWSCLSAPERPSSDERPGKCTG